jgi:hypothetical protein
MSSPAPAQARQRSKIKWQIWAASVAVPIIVALIGIYKPDSGAKEKTPGNFTYIGSVSVIENEIQQFMPGQTEDAATKARVVSAVNLAKAGQFEASRAIFEQLAKDIPVPAILTSAGALNAENGNAQAARAYYQQALAKEPDYKAALNDLTALQTVKAEGRPIAGGHEVEPNNDIFHANILPLSTTVVAEISSTSDTDFFRFTAGHLPRDYYRISLKNLSTTLSPEITVYDQQKNQMFYDYRDTVGAEFDHDFVPVPDSVYYVQVAGRGNTVGPYSLTITPLHKYDRFEPNDDIASAKSIPLGKSVEASIMDPLDSDFFQVKSGSAAGNLTVSVKNLSTTLAPGITVYDQQKNQIFYDYRDTAGADFDRAFPVQPNTAYFVQIAGRGNTAGAYSLTVK